MKEPFLVGDEIIEAEVQPLTIIVKSDNLQHDIEPIKRVVIDVEATTYHADRCVIWHPDTEDWVNRIKPGAFEAKDSAGRHLRGLVDLGLKFTEMGVPIQFRHPETHLHPKAQCQLADFFIHLSKMGEQK